MFWNISGYFIMLLLVRNNYVSGNWPLGSLIKFPQYVDKAVFYIDMNIYTWHEHWGYSSQNILSQLLLLKMESNTSLFSHIFGEQTYFYLYHCNAHVLGTTCHSPQLQLLKVVRHQKEAQQFDFLWNSLHTTDQTWSQIVLL